MATMSRNTPQVAANGVITAPSKAMVGGNRKKQKRRAKQAAKAAQAAAPQSQPAEPDYDEDPLGYADEDDYYSEADNQRYEPYHPADHHTPNGYDLPSPNAGSKKSKKKKKKAGGGEGSYVVGSDRLPDLPNAPAMDHKTSRAQQQNIWNTTTQQERQNIKQFWLTLSEEERKSLLRIEKEAVLRKMKQQQKHSCSCTVCGRKRTAIEEELEVLYEGYYEELENYAHGDQPPLSGSGHMLPAPLSHQHKPHPLATPPPTALQTHHRSSHLLEHLDEDEEEDELDDEEDDEPEYSGDEVYSDEEYSEEEEIVRPPVPDFLDFGQNLTVKDNLLTVADDLLKNDGRKFIEMMEQLAERRMQRETEAEFSSNHPHAGNYRQNDAPYGNDESMGPDDEFDEDEGSYDSQEDFDDELDEEDEIVSLRKLHRRYMPTEKQQSGLTEEQRMQEGRRMFQIFAARMFEHRVLTAYKEKVAAERQQKLLEELQDEEKLEAQREAKKKRDAEKKKDKKRQQQAAKAEERAKKEAEKAAEEARMKEAEEKKQEEQRRKKEEQRKKKDEEKRRLEEERQRKEADRLRRQQEEQQRREDAERKARESRAKKEEARKREKEDKEAKERSAKDRKVQEEKAKPAKTVKQDEPVSEATPQIVKRPSQPTMVAVPGVFNKQNQPPANTSSPKLNIATPAVSKSQLSAAKPKQSSQQGSHASSPRQAQSQISSAPSKSSSPGGLPSQSMPAIAPKMILQKTSTTQQQATPPVQAMSPIQPPPGMQQPSLPQQQAHQPYPPMAQQNTFPPMPPPNMFPHQQAQLPGIAGANIRPAMFPQAMPNVNIPGRLPSYGAANVNGMHGPPSSGMLGAQPRGNGFFDSSGGVSPNAPPGFGIGPTSTQISPIGMPLANTTPSSENMRTPLSGHARQASGAETAFEDVYGRRNTRPAPIQRPSSVKQQNDGVDDLSRHLGSSALLGDDEDEQMAATRQAGPLDNLGFRRTSGAFPTNGWHAPAPFGQSPDLAQNWGGLTQSGMPGWSANNANFTANNRGFGSIGSASAMHRPSVFGSSNRPLTIRIAVCQACKQLSSMSPGHNNDYHDINTLVHQMEINRPPLDAPPTLKEIEDICETEGDAQNGGGELQIRRSNTGSVSAIRWQQEAATPEVGHERQFGSLGEIGSPLPGKVNPSVIGFGAPGRERDKRGSNAAAATTTGVFNGRNMVSRF